MKNKDIDIDTLKTLAKIHLTEEESAATVEKLYDIISMINEINEIEVENIKPLSNPMDQTQPLRLDEVTEINESKYYQLNAHETNEGYYVVPQVVE
jgi:aspartyl-tRNA(Asn)/glutamyl-tRNA(Gln) amidotransferase subunit C